jgi:uncharacterized protein (TIGR02147 family)
MFNIFNVQDYREIITTWIKSRGESAYGQKGRIASHLQITSSLLSQILKREKSLTLDQACGLTEYMALNELESDYFMLLVELDRAGTAFYRKKLQIKIDRLLKESMQVGKRVPRNQELSDEQKALYYSSWLFTAIRNLSAISRFQSIKKISETLNIDEVTTRRVVNFLVQNNLCSEKQGVITFVSKSIHIDRDSPYVNKHHQNWRLRAIHQMEIKKESDLFFSSPMSISHETAEEIRKMLPIFIQSIMDKVAPSESEVGLCLNIDWFQF